MTLDEVLALLLAECEKVKTRAAWAKAHGVSPTYVSDVLMGRREPGQSILDALGLERIVTYEVKASASPSQNPKPRARRPVPKAKITGRGK